MQSAHMAARGNCTSSLSKAAMTRCACVRMMCRMPATGFTNRSTAVRLSTLQEGRNFLLTFKVLIYLLYCYNSIYILNIIINCCYYYLLLLYDVIRFSSSSRLGLI